MKNVLLVSGVLLLSACGGGGGGSSTPSTASIAGGGTTPPPQATASITANPTTVMQGDSTVISWNSSNASSCTASGYWSGNKATSGSETVAMTSYGEQSFTVKCGTASSSVTVQVNTEDSEGSCVNPHNAEIYESYLGVYELPMPQIHSETIMLNQSVLKIMGLSGYIIITKERVRVGLKNAAKINTLG